VCLWLAQYYDNTIFHRVIAGFMVQGGDPTGSGTGGESAFGVPFADEFHSRLRFNHRGLLAMANENKPNSNHSQFFFTLDACEFLEKKHTIFGKASAGAIRGLWTCCRANRLTCVRTFPCRSRATRSLTC
jgi:peptidyl-prolyl cis-trans isomerase SDCCAG10